MSGDAESMASLKCCSVVVAASPMLHWADNEADRVGDLRDKQEDDEAAGGPRVDRLHSLWVHNPWQSESFYLSLYSVQRNGSRVQVYTQHKNSKRKKYKAL